VDLSGIGQRIVALPVPPANYTGLSAGRPGEIFLEQGRFAALGGRGTVSVERFSLVTRHAAPLVSGVRDFVLSADGTKFLYLQGRSWGIASAEGPPVKRGTGALPMAQAEVWVEPRAEWAEIYHEAWRLERQYFYASNYDGLNLAQAERTYARFLPGLASREDLNFLMTEMLGKLSTSHTFISGGDKPRLPPAGVGFLGADYSLANGHYRIAHIYHGDIDASGPLARPGLGVHAGEYILAVNGLPVTATDNIYKFFLHTAGKLTNLTVGPNPDGTGARQITVTPVGNEVGLRHIAWIRHNIAEVNRLSDGKLAYVYMPDTAAGGYTSFNRYYFAQVDKQGVIIDDRFNSGGQAANYVIDILMRKLWNYWYMPFGHVWSEPGGTIFGPKAMLINQYAGSGGDLMPWFFQHLHIGPLIGERTWGGEVGETGYPPLMDGGSVTAPNLAFFTTAGQWGIENKGVTPEIPVEMDPAAWRQGHDPQLEKAVQVLMGELKAHPPAQPHVPPFPNYYAAPGSRQ
ncbi:MAG: PDZ domain-containing protein, partial [Terriglobales bacterium]